MLLIVDFAPTIYLPGKKVKGKVIPITGLCGPEGG